MIILCRLKFCFSSRLSNFVSYKFQSKLKMSNVCNVAVCQFTATNDKHHNLSIVKRLVEKASQENAKMVFLPENSDYIASNKTEIRVLAEPLSGQLISEYRSLAKEYKLWISLGGFHELLTEELDEAPLSNSHVLINDYGEIISVYRKIHLFDVSLPERNINLQESEFTRKGSEIVPPIDTPAGKLGLSICYDLRFPEVSILLRKMGADILTFPSAFTHVTGEIHWEPLLKARAIENQCYVIAAAQYGKHNESRCSHGQSLIIDPWGKTLGECPKYNVDKPTDESISVAAIYLGNIQNTREEMPVFDHRRNDLYRLSLVNDTSVQIDDHETFTFGDKIIPGRTVFYKTKFSYAFTNIKCVVPGHVLVSSRRLAKRLEDLTPDEVTDIFQTVVKVQKVMETVKNTQSSTICIQDGKDAGQTVQHVHVHILPRKPSDFPQNDDVYQELAKHDRDNDPSTFRSLEDMSEEASILRKYFY